MNDRRRKALPASSIGMEQNPQLKRERRHGSKDLRAIDGLREPLDWKDRKSIPSPPTTSSCFVNDLLTGSEPGMSGRRAGVTKSSPIGTFTDSHRGGWTGARLHSAGVDGPILSDPSETLFCHASWVNEDDRAFGRGGTGAVGDATRGPAAAEVELFAGVPRRSRTASRAPGGEVESARSSLSWVADSRTETGIRFRFVVG